MLHNKGNWLQKREEYSSAKQGKSFTIYENGSSEKEVCSAKDFKEITKEEKTPQRIELAPQRRK